MNLFSAFTRKTASRCEHLSPTGRRCSQPACSTHPTLCFTHKPKAEPVEVEKPRKTPAADAAFLAEITQVCGDLETPEQVRRALSLTLKAFVSRQISRETAGTSTYILQMLLRSQREIAYQKKLERDAAKLAEDEDDGYDNSRFRFPTADRSHMVSASPAALPSASALPVAGSHMECGSPAVAVTVSANPEPEKREPRSRTPKGEPAATSPEQTNRSEDRPLQETNMECASPAAAVTVTANPEPQKREPRSRTPHEPVSKRNLPPPVVNASPTPPLYLDHFYPRDPTLAPGLQSPLNTCAPPPDAEELRWRELSRQYARNRRR